jgi:hypothetical protein
MSAEPFAWIIASTQEEATAAFKRWSFGGQTHSLEGKRVCFKGAADARYLLAERRKEDGPDSTLGIWKIQVEAEQASLAVSETGVPPYKDGDIITVCDRQFGIKYKAQVDEVLLAGARYPWVVHFESIKPIEPGDSRHYVGSLEADDEGNSPYIVKS